MPSFLSHGFISAGFSSLFASKLNTLWLKFLKLFSSHGKAYVQCSKTKGGGELRIEVVMESPVGGHNSG